MAFCPECNHEIPAAVAVCPHCGYDFPLEDPKSTARLRRWELSILGILGSVAILAAMTLRIWVENAPVYAAILFVALGFACLYCTRAFWWLDGRIARLEADLVRQRRAHRVQPGSASQAGNA
jgi:hypothetical protein